MPGWLIEDLQRIFYGLIVIGAFAVVVGIMFGSIMLMVNFHFVIWIFLAIFIIWLAWLIGSHVTYN